MISILISRKLFFACASAFFLTIIPCRLIMGGDYKGQRPFEISAFYAYDDSAKVYLDLGISIEYRRLVFFKQQDLFKADYRVYIQIFERGRDRSVWGDVWEKNVKLPTYRATKSPSGISRIDRRIYLRPGRYRVETAIEVIGTNIKYKRETEIEIPGVSEGAVSLSEPLLSIPTESRKAEKPPGGEIEVLTCAAPVTNGFKISSEDTYADFNMWLRAAFNLSVSSYDEKSGKCSVSIRISDYRGGIILYNRQQVYLDETGHTIVCFDFNVDNYNIGVYRMEISAEIEETKRRDLVRKEFAVLFNRGSLRQYFEDTKDLLLLIASEDEINSIVTASPEDRIDEWKKFWSDRGSARGRGSYNYQEFLRNINYVLKHYPDSSGGWKTDMGRIFISNGRPDKIVTRRNVQSGGYYQFWYYYSRRVIYIFADKFGTGDYRYLSTRNF